MLTLIPRSSSMPSTVFLSVVDWELWPFAFCLLTAYEVWGLLTRFPFHSPIPVTGTLSSVSHAPYGQLEEGGKEREVLFRFSLLVHCFRTPTLWYKFTISYAWRQLALVSIGRHRNGGAAEERLLAICTNSTSFSAAVARTYEWRLPFDSIGNENHIEISKSRLSIRVLTTCVLHALRSLSSFKGILKLDRCRKRKFLRGR